MPSVLWRQEGHPACKKTEWWGAGMVICLERGADLHMAQMMPLPLTVSGFSKIQICLPFWYRLTRVVPDKWPLNECVCVNIDIMVNNSRSLQTEPVTYQPKDTFVSSLQVASLLVDWNDGLFQFAEPVLKRIQNRQHVLGHGVTPFEWILQHCKIVHFLQPTQCIPSCHWTANCTYTEKYTHTNVPLFRWTSLNPEIWLNKIFCVTFPSAIKWIVHRISSFLHSQKQTPDVTDIS